ncbi:tetratricopeptide repeat protein [Leptospira wolffii]|uniref:Tetratricopeptide repeat protein n=1 Tax=Leptospira wolffii TaxID=409998 RepID=A0ABV5BTV5_9LEPT
MGIIDKIKSFIKPERTLEELRSDPNLLEVYDEFGRQFFITKEEWRKNVLPGQLEKDWDNADALYSDIAHALNDEFYPDLLKPSERLIEIDSDPERAVTIRGIVLMKNGKLNEAEEIFLSYMDKYGRSGVILNNYAKIQADRGEDSKSFETLQESLKLDPNLENSLGWLMAILNEREGNESVRSALLDLSKIKGSWRPQLWLARLALEEGDFPSALRLYKSILSITNDSDALKMISGDLGNSGYIKEILELINPIYSPEKHGPHVGLNLLEACKSLGNYQLGLQVVQKMRSQNWQPYAEEILQYYNHFEDMKPVESDFEAGKDKIYTVVLTRPIWLYGLGGAKWLEISKGEEASKIVFLPLNALSDEVQEVTAQREDDLGQISRGIPLFIAEKLYFNSPLSPEVLIFSLEKKGVVLMGGTLDWEYLESLGMQGITYFVTGEVTYIKNGYNITLHLWNVLEKKELTKVERKCLTESLGSDFSKLRDSLEEKISKISNYKSIKSPAYYSSLPSEQIAKYVQNLAQSLTLTLIDNEYGSSELLWGERNIYGSALSLAVDNPDLITPKILFASDMLKGISFKSKVVSEFKRQLFALVKKGSNPQNEFEKLVPLFQKKFNESGEYSAASFKNKYGALYDEWLVSIEKDDKD